MDQTIIKIPEERIGVFLGKNSETLKLLEEKLGLKLEISHNGSVTMEGNADKIYFGKNVIKAIGRGFSPEVALYLVEKDDFMFELIDLDEFLNTENSIHRVKGRIIGSEGKVKIEIEKMADCYISVYGNTVGIIAPFDSISFAKEAIGMIIKGSMISSVMNFLSRKKEEVKISRLMGTTRVS
ncbi:MAG: KH domain-containing protein [Candidatus Micrarchaeota archaeon]|nr:KH domain-containing protein [Candidatus Micrarchaeota archaeon]